MKQALTLYTNPLTSNGIKMTLMFNAIEYQPKVVEIQLHQREQKSAQFLQLNPAGKIPVLVDGDTVLTESNAILYYLANKFHYPLWPKQTALQSEILKWLFFQSAQWSEATTPFAHRRVVLPRWGFYARVDLETDVVMHFHEVMENFNDRLTHKLYLVNDELSIADLSLASNLIFASESKMPLDDYPHVSRWLSRVSQTAWWQKTKQSLADSLI